LPPPRHNTCTEVAVDRAVTSIYLESMARCMLVLRPPTGKETDG
jgi:hypothetical protein